MFWSVVKAIAGVSIVSLLAFVLFLTYKGWQAQQYMEELRKLGAFIIPDSEKFFIGATMRFAKFRKMATDANEVLPFNIQYVVDDTYTDNEGKRMPYDAGKHPLFAMTVMAKPIVFLCDPDAIQEVFSTKNRLFDKTESAPERFKELLGNSFLFALADDDWKTKRKATAHAFYKDRIINMMECLKSKLAERCAAWIKTVEAEGKARIDIAKEFETIFARNIIHIAFGEDISDQPVEILFMTREDTLEKERRVVTFAEALKNIETQCQMTFNARYRLSKIAALQMVVFGKDTYKPDWLYKDLRENCRIVRQVIYDFVDQRKSGARKAQVGADADLLSLFFQSPEVFTRDFIVDELLDFFFAGVQTTQFGSQTLMAHYFKDPASLARLRQEFDEKIRSPARVEDPSLASKTRLEELNALVQYESVADLSYLTMCMMEALRFQAPAPSSSMYRCLEDVKLGRFHFKKNDEFVPYTFGIHKHSGQWPNPHKFDPNRFDPSHKASLTADGQKRNPFAYVPFSGGRRICFGKTFAEFSLKYTACYMTQMFNVRLEDPRYENEYPVAHFGQSKCLPLWLELTKHS